MANEIKVAFSGARRAGSFFKAFQTHPETEIVALCDPHADTLAASGRATGVTQLYNVFETMLDEARPDVVVVSSPMQYHAPQAIAALQRNIHVLSEVTAAVSVDECRWLVQACSRSDAIYMMAENYMYMKPNILVQALVEAGLFGETYYAEGEYLHDVSSPAPHAGRQPDLALLLAGRRQRLHLPHPQFRPLPHVDQRAARTHQLHRQRHLDRP